MNVYTYSICVLLAYIFISSVQLSMSCMEKRYRNKIIIIIIIIITWHTSWNHSTWYSPLNYSTWQSLWNHSTWHCLWNHSTQHSSWNHNTQHSHWYHSTWYPPKTIVLYTPPIVAVPGRKSLWRFSWTGPIISKNSPFVFHLGFVHPLQDVALHQCLPSSSVCCFPNPGGSLLLCYVILPSSAWSSSWPLPSPWLPLCAALCPPIVL